MRHSNLDDVRLAPAVDLQFARGTLAGLTHEGSLDSRWRAMTTH